jgi:hypothetical protein
VVAWISPILRTSKDVLCILFEQDKYTLALFSICSKQASIIAITDISSKDVCCGDMPLLHLPLLISSMNRFSTSHASNPSFAMIVQQHNSLPQEKIFEYRLLTHCMSLILTHLVSAQDARKHVSSHDQNIPLEIQGAVRLFMEDL